MYNCRLRIRAPRIAFLLSVLLICFSFSSTAAKAAGKSEPSNAAANATPGSEISQFTAICRWGKLGGAILTDGAVFLVVGFGCVPLIRRAVTVPDYLAPLMSSIVYGLAALVVFFAFLHGASFGVKVVNIIYVACLISFLLSAAVQRKSLGAALGGRDSVCVLALIAISAVAFLALQYLPLTGLHYSELARVRATPWGLPYDNIINEVIAQRLAINADPRHCLGSWLSSDRPPLQTGVQLMCLPLTTRLGISQSEFLYPIAGLLFQTGWICGVWALLRAIGCDRKTGVRLCLALMPTGFLFVNTVFIWPKLAAAGFSLGVYALLIPRGCKPVIIGILTGVCTALAMLCHGGTFFFLAPVIAIVALPPRWPGRRAFIAAIVAAAVLYAPWIWYQKVFDPPGDRLIKMHIGGIAGVDSRSPGAIIYEAYARAGWNGVVENKKANVLAIVSGASWPMLLKFDPSSIARKRNDIFFHTFRAIGLFNLGWAALPVVLWRKKWRQYGVLMIVVCLTSLAFWCLLMFGPAATIIHQGPYATQLLLMIVSAGAMQFLSGRLFAVVAVANACIFLADFVPIGNPGILDSPGGLDYLAVLLLIAVISASLFLAFGEKPAAILFDDASVRN